MINNSEIKPATEVAIDIVRETNKAILFSFTDHNNEEHWIPKSCIVEMSVDDSAWIHDWILRQKGII